MISFFVQIINKIIYFISFLNESSSTVFTFFNIVILWFSIFDYLTIEQTTKIQKVSVK